MEFEKELSYKQICKEFGESESSSGRVRQLQLNRWQEEYNIEKIGRGKYIIHGHLTKEESQTIKDRKNYANFLQATLLQFLSESETSTTVYTYRDIREHLMMVNPNYFPVKYYQKELNIKISHKYTAELTEALKRIWFDNADSHDEYAIKAALRKLSDRRLISIKETHVFYKHIKLPNGNTVSSKPELATDEQEAQFLQVGIEYLNKVGCKNVGELYSKSKIIQQGYYRALVNYIKTLGYDRYARAFVITRASELNRMVKFLAPEFNEMQVNRYLKSKRFNSIPKDMNEQLVEELIKYHKAVFATAEELKKEG